MEIPPGVIVEIVRDWAFEISKHAVMGLSLLTAGSAVICNCGEEDICHLSIHPDAQCRLGLRLQV